MHRASSICPDICWHYFFLGSLSVDGYDLHAAVSVNYSLDDYDLLVVALVLSPDYGQLEEKDDCQ